MAWWEGLEGSFVALFLAKRDQKKLVMSFALLSFSLVFKSLYYA